MTGTATRAAGAEHPLRPVARIGIGLLLATAAVVIALYRLRMSPVYPRLNSINSDFYVYQVVGNSWVHGHWPYRDVFDVKGPTLYLLFAGFARIRPWSAAPPFVMLVLLATATLWLAFTIARRWLTVPAAVASALACATLIYLTPVAAMSSFTCEELAVPGILLALWLVQRLLAGEEVSTRWWLLDGVVFGLLFWAKYQVITPWAGLLLALLVLHRKLGISLQDLGRVVAVHLIGAMAATVVVLAWYLPVLGQMFHAYFAAKSNTQHLGSELSNEGQFLRLTWSLGPAPLIVVAVLAVILVVISVRQVSTAVFLIALVASAWGAIFAVRHPQNALVPMSFAAIGIPLLLRSLPRPSRMLAAIAAFAVAVGAAIPAVQDSRQNLGLFDLHPSIRCRELTGTHRVRLEQNPTLAIAAQADHQPILSIGTLTSAQTSAASHTVNRHKYAFVDASWAGPVGAVEVQTRYLRQRTYSWVTVHLPRTRAWEDVRPQLAAMRPVEWGPTRSQLDLLTADYTPVLACANTVLLRADADAP